MIPPELTLAKTHLRTVTSSIRAPRTPVSCALKLYPQSHQRMQFSHVTLRRTWHVPPSRPAPPSRTTKLSSKERMNELRIVTSWQPQMSIPSEL